MHLTFSMFKGPMSALSTLAKICISGAVIALTEISIYGIYRYLYPADVAKFKPVNTCDDLSEEDTQIAVHARFTRDMTTTVVTKEVSKLKVERKMNFENVFCLVSDNKGKLSYRYEYRPTWNNTWKYEPSIEFDTKVVSDTGFVNNLGRSFVNTTRDFSHRFNHEWTKFSFGNHGNTILDRNIKSFYDFFADSKIQISVDQILYLKGKVVNKIFMYDSFTNEPYLFEDTLHNVMMYHSVDFFLRISSYLSLFLMNFYL